MRCIILISALLMSLPAIAQNDATKITEAQYALDKNDCKAAKEALNEVSEEGRKQPFFNYYSAIADSCLNDLDSAIYHYNKYLESVPDNPEVIKKIAEISYLNKKNKQRLEADKL